MKKIFIPGVLMLLVLLAYRDQHVPLIKFIAKASRRADIFPGSSAAFTKDNNGRAVMSWVRNINDTTSVFCYSVIEGGRQKKIILVPTSINIHPHAENLPKVIFKPSGEIIAVWGIKNPTPKNKYSGLICYSQSFDNGNTWTAAKKLVTDSAAVDQRYSDVVLTKHGEAAIVWLDNRKTTTKEGSALFGAVTKGRSGFINEQLISEPACQCCRTKFFCDSRGNLHVVYRGIINDSIRDVVHVTSKDGGRTFSAPEKLHNDNWVLRGCPHTGPAMTETTEGLHFAWFTGGLNKGSFYIRSNDNGRTFSAYDSISTLGTHPQLAATPGGQVVAVWDESTRIGNEYYKRIGMQVRNEKGASVIKDFVTADTSYNTYPVISSINNNSVLIAYTSKEKNNEYIRWQQVRVNQ